MAIENPSTTTNGSADRILRVGIIGCGEISQVAHIPNINNLAHRFRTTYLCDISNNALQHCAGKVLGGTPKTTSSAAELCGSPDVDVVIIANADAYHMEHGLLALQNDKYCLIEKPAALCFRDIDRLIEAERTSKGKVFVGTMRRYARAFIDAVQEVGDMDNITYARVRDIIGPNSTFVDQSCTFPQRFNDFSDVDTKDRAARDTDIFDQAISKEFGLEVTPQSTRMLRVLGGLGTHDLSAMREIIGMPKSVTGAFLKLPGIFSVLFNYENFPVVYESGLSGVPQFDAHIEVYSESKIVRVEFDTPYIKGLPVTMAIREKVSEGGFQERKVRKTYEDPYTLELLEFYDCAVSGRTPKSGAGDARRDVELFQMIMTAGFKN
ncbi:hypothetical protein FE257_012488 [Aspergillus nanangensis]|uniref:Gfo/Idh/MocA-like oxidoreductase N-terminal domain-containing protein n=1 Tax=Aspergillus nanangensis TaxID=2582783 RepID=A0AAD4CV82_ASPNN|nr:hypothetical protein FE257_012488 [Aspergillus nanangensis]